MPHFGPLRQMTDTSGRRRLTTRSSHPVAPATALLLRFRWGATMAGRTKQRVASIAAVIAFGAVVLMTGCATGSGGNGAPPPSIPSSAPSSAPPEELAKPYPMPDLGPSPAPVPLSDDEVERMRVEQEDASWAAVLITYPNAVRPQVAFEGYVTAADQIEVMSACYTAAGLPLDLARNGRGTVLSVGTSVTTEAEAVSQFSCQAAHPHRPVPPPSHEQLGYIYDYFVRFLVPCYELNGIVNPPPPSREYFVANWPNQGWAPSTGSMPLEMEFDAALYEACPPPP